MATVLARLLDSDVVYGALAELVINAEDADVIDCLDERNEDFRSRLADVLSLDRRVKDRLVRVLDFLPLENSSRLFLRKHINVEPRPSSLVLGPACISGFSCPLRVTLTRVKTSGILFDDFQLVNCTSSTLTRVTLFTYGERKVLGDLHAFQRRSLRFRVDETKKISSDVWCPRISSSLFFAFYLEKKVFKSDLEWIIAKISNQEVPHAQGANIRRRIFNSVNKVAEVDEKSGCLRKVTDTEKVIDKISKCITGAETVPYLDALLLTAQTSQRVLKILLARFSVFVNLLADNALDREVTLRLFAIPRMCDAEILGTGNGVKEFSQAIKKLIEDTIDPVIRKQAVDVSGELDALLVLASTKPPVLTRDQLVDGIKSGSLCLKCDTTDHNECEITPTLCLNCRGDRTACIRGCAKPCRVCGEAHPGRSIIACLEETVHGTKKRKIEEIEEEPEEKRMRSIREYKEAKRRHKEEKKTSNVPSTPQAFEKLLKDSVAKCCYEHVGDRPEDKGADIPQWRRVYRSIAAVLLEKEARLPDDVRFRCSSDDERASVIKRVRLYCEKHFSKHAPTS